MSGFVTQNAHQTLDVATLGKTAHATLETLEIRMREIERNRDSGYAVG